MVTGPGPLPGGNSVAYWGGNSAPVSCVAGTGFCLAITHNTSLVGVLDTVGESDVVTTNGGKTWQAYTDLPIATMTVLAADCPTASVCWVAGSGAQDQAEMAESTDGGQTWTLKTPQDEDAYSWWADSIDCPTATTCWITGATFGKNHPVVEETADGGATWTLSTDPTLRGLEQVISLTCLHVAGGQPTCYGAARATSLGGPVVIFSRDGGATWNGVQTAYANAWMNSVSCADTTHSWATGAAVSGSTTLAMTGTRNGGRSWSSVTSDATDQEGQVSCATVNFCLSTADNGLWVTHNDGGLSRAKLVSHPLPHLSGATVAARAGHSVTVTGQCPGCPGRGSITVKAPGKRATTSRVAIGVNGFYSLTIKKVAKGTTTVRLSAASSKPRTVRVHGYSAAGPSVTSISVNAGPVTGGMKVTIKDRNFVRVSAVYFGTRRGTRLKVVSKTELTVVTPAGTQGRYVTVDTTNGGPSPATGRAAFNYLPVPAFISLSPDTGRRRAVRRSPSPGPASGSLRPSTSAAARGRRCGCFRPTR